jgi:integrase
MGIKFDARTNKWNAFFSKRHPITKQPRGLKRIGLDSKAEAIKVERELVIQLEKSILETTVPIWPKMVKEYLESKSLCDWTQKTLQNAKFCLEAHTFEKWKLRRVDSITAYEIKALLIERVGDKSVGTRQTLLKFIRGAFQFGVEKRYVTANPAPNIRFKCGDKLPKVLTAPQAELLLDKAKELGSEWYYHWALALYTGMRNGEQYALTWDKVNFEQRTILVDSSWNPVDGFKSTKSGDDRIVSIAPNLLLTLKELKLRQFDLHFVLPRSRNWDKGEQARMLGYFLEGIGLPKVKYHDLRATWATIMMSNGVEPIKVMSMGGWKSLSRLQIYVRKAGLNVKGITDNLNIHDPCKTGGEVIILRSM